VEAIVAEFLPRPLSRASSTTSTSTARQGQLLDAVPQSILPQFHGHEIDSVVSVTNHQRDALGTKSAR